MQHVAVVTPAGPFRLRSLLFTVYLPTFLLGIGQGAVLPVIPLFARELGGGVGIAGAVFAARGFGTLLFDVPAGLAESRWGDRRTLLAGTLAIVVVGIGSGLSQDVLQLGLFTLLFGAGNSVFQVARLAYVSEVTPVQHRGRAISLLGGTNRIGMFVGPIMGGLLAEAFGLQAAFFFQAVVGGLAVGSVLLWVRGGHSVPLEAGLSVYARLVQTMVRNRRSFLTWGLAVITLQIIRGSRQVLIPLWGDHVGLDVATIGLVVGLSSGIDMLLFYPVGVVMDRWGRKWVATSSLVVLAVGLALLPLSHTLETLLLVGVLTGIGNGLGTGIVMTLGADLSPMIGRGEFLGVWRLVGDVGTAGGPLVIGAIAQAITLGAAALVAAGVGVIGAIFLAAAAAETLKQERGDERAELIAPQRPGAPPGS